MSRLERFETRSGAVGYRSPALAELCVPHAFSTRIGPGASAFDVGALDEPTRAALGELAGVAARELHDLKQVHGKEVHELTGAPSGTSAESNTERIGDGLVSETAGRLLLVRTADCVPLLLARSDGRRVAAVHAGWRGLVAGVLARAVEVLGTRDLVAAIGPCLGLARFEIGPEVAAEFERAELAEVLDNSFGPRPHADLRAAAAIQLERLGLARIDTSDACTWDRPDEFWSYRRDVTHGERDKTGRLAAVIAPQA